MERELQITSELVVAYWQCPRKAFCLLNESQQVVPHELELVVDEHRYRNRHQYLKRLKNRFGDVPYYSHRVLGRGHPVLSNAELEYEDLLATIDVLLKVDGGQSRRKVMYTPVLVGGTHSVTQEQTITLTFAGLVLSRLQQHPCTAGTVLTSDGRIHSIKFGKRIRQIQAIIPVLRSWMQEAVYSPPGVILNKHCPLCPFREQCHAEALRIDHLSLLTGMSQKQIQDDNKKGIFTVTQLAYTYRARKQRRQDSHQRLTYKQALKALAIRDNRIYVVETERLPPPASVHVSRCGRNPRSTFLLSHWSVGHD